jgi:uncharacterized caspase-like protein
VTRRTLLVRQREGQGQRVSHLVATVATQFLDGDDAIVRLSFEATGTASPILAQRNDEVRAISDLGQARRTVALLDPSDEGGPIRALVAGSIPDHRGLFGSHL